MALERIIEKTWKNRFKDWSMLDCSLDDNRNLFIFLRKNVSQKKASMLSEGDIPGKCIAIALAEGDSKKTVTDLSNWYFPKLGSATIPSPCGVISSRDTVGTVASLTVEKNVTHAIDKKQNPHSVKIKNIDGHAYSVGNSRRIYKRLDADKWERINNGFPEIKDNEYIFLNDIDGFNENELYIVGSGGDAYYQIWKYNGEEWKQQQFPETVQLYTVTCAGDGNVYITDHNGSIWKGHDSTWTKVYDGDFSIPWNDAIWYKDQLWLSSDYMARVWNGTELVTFAAVTNAAVNSQYELATGHMDIRAGLVAIASLDNLYVYDGANWHTIVEPYEAVK